MKAQEVLNSENVCLAQTFVESTIFTDFFQPPNLILQWRRIVLLVCCSCPQTQQTNPTIRISCSQLSLLLSFPARRSPWSTLVQVVTEIAFLSRKESMEHPCPSCDWICFLSDNERKKDDRKKQTNKQNPVKNQSLTHLHSPRWSLTMKRSVLASRMRMPWQ